MACYFNGISRVECLEAINLGVKTVPNRVNCFVETGVNLAIASRPDIISRLSSIKVGDPVINRV